MFSSECVQSATGRKYFLPVVDWTHSLENILSISYYRVNIITTVHNISSISEMIQSRKHIYIHTGHISFEGLHDVCFDKLIQVNVGVAFAFYTNTAVLARHHSYS